MYIDITNFTCSGIYEIVNGVPNKEFNISKYDLPDLFSIPDLDRPKVEI